MADFLSDEWVDGLRMLGGELPPMQGASVSCQHEISGTPEGKVRFYTVWIDGVLSDVAKGKLDDPDCLISAKYENAKEILSGVNTAEAAFMQGDLKVEGDYKKFLIDLHGWRQSPEYKKLWKDLGSF